MRKRVPLFSWDRHGAINCRDIFQAANLYTKFTVVLKRHKVHTRPGKILCHGVDVQEIEPVGFAKSSGRVSLNQSSPTINKIVKTVEKGSI